MAFLGPLATATKTQKLITAAVGLALLAVAGYAALIAPMRTRVAELEIRLAALQRELTQTRKAVLDLARYRRETAEMERRLETIKRKLPEEREIPPLYRALYDAAFKIGLAVSLFQPRDQRIQDYYVEVPIALTAEGSYHQLGKFFETVAEFPRVVTVGDLKMTGLGRSTSPLRAEMTLATYVYRPVGSPPAPKPGGARQPASGTPATSPAGTPRPGGAPSRP